VKTQARLVVDQHHYFHCHKIILIRLSTEKSRLTAGCIVTFTSALVCAAALLLVNPTQTPLVYGQQAPSAVPTIRVTSRLVFLDVTVLDKKGRPVVTGLSKDDFLITEDKKPQRIFSFEEPQTHVVEGKVSDDNPVGNAPLTIFVLDLLNSRFEDFAYIRYEVQKYLAAQPAQLTSPAELMVLGNQSLEMVQGYTRNKEDLMYALNHVPAVLPYKFDNGAFAWERFGQSIDALQQIALQNAGIRGRKNIVWVGHGAPGIYTAPLVGQIVDELNQYAKDTTNMLVDSRVSLFVIYPELHVQGSAISISAMDANVDIGDDDDPFAGNINFGVFVDETGGKLFYNRNDVDAEMRLSQLLGSEYYTLTYQPHEGDANGKFRRIRVSLRNPNLHALTKAGYFAPEKGSSDDSQQERMVRLAEAVRSTIPFQGLNVTIGNVVRHPDTHTVEFVVLVKDANLGWQTTEDGKSATHLMLAAASLTDDKNILASKIENLIVSTRTQDAAQLPQDVTYVPLLIRVPRKTRDVRVVIETEDGGRMGAVDLDRKTIDAATAIPTPEPHLMPSQQRPEAPSPR